MAIDYTTSVGKLRYRVADLDETFPFLPDAVYSEVYAEQGNNLNRATKVLGMMILGQLSFCTRQDMGLQLSYYGQSMAPAYKEFLTTLIKDPAFADSPSILAYGGSTGDGENSITQFMLDWKRNFAFGTEAQQLANNALDSPNDGSTYGGVFVQQ